MLSTYRNVFLERKRTMQRLAARGRVGFVAAALLLLPAAYGAWFFPLPGLILSLVGLWLTEKSTLWLVGGRTWETVLRFYCPMMTLYLAVAFLALLRSFLMYSPIILQTL